jgi:hypothetical protein
MVNKSCLDETNKSMNKSKLGDKKGVYKTHNRHSSMEIKMDKKNISNMKDFLKKSESIVNQQGLPAFNNINIYTTNKNDINLKQYIINKVNNHKAKLGHVRSVSNNFY